MDHGNWMQPEMLRELSAATAAANGNLAQKRFIMFDKSGDKGRIMFSPNVFYEFPSLAADEQNANINNNINNNSFQHVYREAMASFTALQSMRERNRPYSITLCDIGDFGGAATTNNDSDSSSSKLSWDRTSNLHQGSSVIHEENSEDIDALLYSDDEEEEECCSTGHSPGEVTSDEGDEAASGFTGGNFDDDEGSGEGMPKLIDSGAAAAAAAVLSSEKIFVKSRLSSVSKSTQMKKTKQRKEKIRQTVKMLQSLIPGGDDLDPAIVLDEAIHYMKALQMKVVQLEATRQAKL